MAEAPKKKGGKKIPVVVLVIGGVVVVYFLYKKLSSSSSTPAGVSTASGTPAYQYGDGSGGGSGGGGSAGGGTPTTTGTTTATGADYTGTGNTGTNSTPPIFDTAQPGNPYGEGVAYTEPGIGDLPPGVLPVVYNPPNTTSLSPASGALASNPAQGGHSL